MRGKSDVTFEQWGDAGWKDWEIIDLEAFEKRATIIFGNFGEMISCFKNS